MGYPRRRALNRRAVFVAALAASTAIAAPAFAQTTPPVRQSIDGNGVDLFLGALNLTGPALSMGSSARGLSYYRISRNGSWSDNIIGTISVTSTAASVNLGAVSDRFTKSGSTFTNTEGNGASLTLSGSIYTYTESDGTIYHFDSSLPAGYPLLGSARLTDIVQPNGARLTFVYGSVQYCTSSKQGAFGQICLTHATTYHVTSVTSSYGYRLGYYYDFLVTDPDDPTAMDFTAWATPVGVEETNVSTGTTRQQGLVQTVDPDFIVTQTITDPAGRQTKFHFYSGLVVGITLPGDTSESSTYTYSNGTTGRVATVTNAAGTTSYASSDSGAVRTVTVTDALGHVTTYKFDIPSQRMTSMKNALNQTTTWQYDGTGRVTRVTQPEGNYTQITYQSATRNNVTETRQVSKTPGTPADIVTSASYPSSCANAACNEPTWTRDASGNQTDYTYNNMTGQVLTMTAPAPASGAARPKTTYSYTNVGGVSLLSGTSTCITGTSCAGTANEVKTVIVYDSNGLPTSVTQEAGDGSVVATTATSYDDIGNALTVDGPLSGTADTTTYRYDADREVLGVISADPDGSGALKRRAARLTYNGKGQVTRAEVGTVAGTTDANWTAFVTKQQVDTSYDAFGRKTSDRLSAAGTTYGVTQYSYDSAGRLDCSAVRMNSALWGTLPASACTVQAAGSAGPDRITKNASYDALNRVTSVTSGYGVSATASTESTAYTANGRVASVTDGEGNKTSYVYDGVDRLAKTQYPGPTRGSGTSSTTDYEQLDYDATGSVTSRRLRDGTSIAYSYDHLGRLTLKNLPGSGPDVTYSYDNLGRPTGASQSGNALTFSYDALGRLLTEHGPEGTLTSTWDAGGRRTRLQWPDGFYVNYDYDMLGEMTKVRENGATSGVGVLASYTYDDLGNRTHVTGGNGTASAWTPDPISRLATLTHNLSGTASDLTKTFTYNPAGGIASSTSSNDSYAWTAAANVNRNYTANGLDQYTVSGSTTLGYDTRGNLTSSGTDSYTYSSENLLETGPSSTALAYDPLLRLFQVTQGSTVTKFAYDGLELTGEYDSANTLTRRYVYGPGTDEPIVQYDGTGTASRSWLHADERGSIIAMTDSAGNKTAIDSYDEYGIPGSGNTGRFQYTGQAWLPEIGLYYYKARLYSPSLGRFMQTDPIGYGDGMNWYNYVGGDPVNAVDPSGLSCMRVDANGQCLDDIVVTGKRLPPDPPPPPPVKMPGLTTGTPLPNNQSPAPGDPGSPQNKGCTSAGDSIGSTVVDRVGDAHGSIFAAGAASASRAGNQVGAKAIGRAALPGAVLLGGISEGIAAADDHAHGMSVGRSAAIHGTGFAGGLLGGFLLGEAVEPLGGGIAGAIVAGIAGGYGGSKAGEAAGAAVATAAGACR